MAFEVAILVVDERRLGRDVAAARPWVLPPRRQIIKEHAVHNGPIVFSAGHKSIVCTIRCAWWQPGQWFRPGLFGGMPAS
jgi:hypothetical protein